MARPGSRERAFDSVEHRSSGASVETIGEQGGRIVAHTAAMAQAPLDGFDEYRNERNRRRLEKGPRRAMGRNAHVLKEIEAREAQDALNQRLRREVSEFFEDATRQAAQMVESLSTESERETEVSVAREMSEFMSTTLERARQFVEALQGARGDRQESVTDLLPNLRNIVGPTLDSYRSEGAPEVVESQIGLDPFLVEESQATPQGQVEEEDDGVVEFDLESGYSGVEEDEAHVAPVEEHLVAEVLAEPEPEELHYEEAIHDDHASSLLVWFDELAQDQQMLKRALKALVHVGAMKKEQALAVLRDATVPQGH